jgi:hypothetical protein
VDRKLEPIKQLVTLVQSTAALVPAILPNRLDGWAPPALTETSAAQTQIINIPTNSTTISAPPNSLSNDGPQTNSSDDRPREPPNYHMQPWIKTVAQCWQEFHEGISPSPGASRGPAIRKLDEDYGSKWRQGKAISRAHLRRRSLWKVIQEIADIYQLLPENVARKMDVWRKAQLPKSISLPALCGMLDDVQRGKAPPIWGSNHCILLEFNNGSENEY